VPGRKGQVTVVVDRRTRDRARLQRRGLGKLRPAFEKDGTVTPGNASTINDGAAALVVMDEDVAKAEGLRSRSPASPATRSAAWRPQWVMMAPEAVQKLCALTKRRASIDYDLIELNEAFAVQAVALTRKLELDPEQRSTSTAAPSRSATRSAARCARVLTTLLHALQDRGLSKGMAAALCLGGGNAVALVRRDDLKQKERDRFP
jgi:acetyl-CoA C-acetyltransferase